MSIQNITLFFLLSLAVIASFLLVPGKQEQALMYLKDRQFVKAEKIYETLYHKKSHNRNNLTPLIEIYLREGNVDSAIKLHEEYLSTNPQDIEVWENLIQLYKDSMQPEEQITALETLVKYHPEIKYYEQLLDLYRIFEVRGKRLVTVLNKLIELDPQHEKAMNELLFILTASEQNKEADKLFDQYVKLYPDKINNELGELRLKLMLISGRREEAYDWAGHWVSKYQNLSLRNLALLFSNGRNSDLDSALAQSESIDLTEMPTWLIDKFVTQDWTGEKQVVFDVFLSKLNSEQRRRYPVVMTNLAIRNKNKGAIKKWLSVCENETNLTTQQRQSLVLTYFKLGKTSRAVDLLVELSAESNLSEKLLIKSVKYITETNYIDKGLNIFQSYLSEQGMQSQLSDSFVEAMLVLASANGDEVIVKSWLESEFEVGINNKLSTDVMKNMYYSASDHSHLNLAIFIARHIHDRLQNKDSMLLLSNALSALKRPSKYERKEQVALIKNQLETFSLSSRKRRELAFQLLDAGEKSAAIQQFKLLAKNQSPQGQDVKQLLFIWGAAPGENALSWLQERAINSSVNDKGGWLQHLLEAGGAERVIALGKLENIKQAWPADAEDVLIRSYIELQRFAELAPVLKGLVQLVSNNNRLVTLAGFANTAGLTDIEELTWKKLSVSQNKNEKVVRQLGMTAYDRGDLLAAEKYLTQYSRMNKNDWEVSLYLGDIANGLGQQRTARTRYKKSLMLISQSEDESKQKVSAQAYIFHQLGQTKKAMMAYEKLLSRYPGDIELKVEYSDFLIDEGYISKAQALLAGEV